MVSGSIVWGGCMIWGPEKGPPPFISGINKVVRYQNHVFILDICMFISGINKAVAFIYPGYEPFISGINAGIFFYHFIYPGNMSVHIRDK